MSDISVDGVPAVRGRIGQVALLGTGVAITYIVAANIGFQLAFVAEQITTVWAPTGIAVATLLVCGVRWWPAIWVGAFVTNAATTAPLWTALVVATGNTLEAVVAAWALRRVPSFAATLRQVTDVLALLVIAGVMCTAISATIGVTVLCAAAVQPWERFADLWFDWWFGDALGAIIVAPAILTTVRHRWSPRDIGHAAIFLAGTTAVTHLVFGQPLEVSAHPLEYVVFPLVIAAAVSGGPPVTSLVVLGASSVAIWHTARGTGPFAGPEVHASLILLQVFMGVLAATALLLAAAVAERKASEEREREAAAVLRHRDEMLRLAQRAGGVATFEWHVDAQVAHCSAEFFRIFGLPARDGVMTAAEWERFVHPEDRARMNAHLARALENGEPAVADYRIIAADGTPRWLSYAGQHQPTPAGNRMLGTVVDITSRKNLETELRHHAAEVERILESIGEGFVAVDRDFKYIYVNRPAERMLGRARAELIGCTPLDVFPADVVQSARERLESAMATSEPTRYDVHVPGWNRWFENRVYPSATGLSVFFTDVTARVEADAALRESRDVLALAMRGGAMGAWSRDIPTNAVWWSRELEEIFGLEPGAFDRTEAGFFEFVHENDRATVRNAVDGAVVNGTDYVVEFRFRHARGEWRWMEGRGRAVYDDDGQPRTLYGIGIDITERKRAEVALQQAKAVAEEGQQRLAEANKELARRVLEQQTLLDVLPIGIGLAMDRECRHIRTNRAFAETLGLSPDTNASKTAPVDERPTNFRVFTPDGVEVPDEELPMQVAAREGREVRDVELDIVHEDGRVVRLLEYAAPLADEHGTPRGAVGAFVDVTAAHHARATLARSEERYRRIFETVGVSLLEQDFSRVQAALDRLRDEGVDDVEAYLSSRPAFVDECLTLVNVADANRAALRMFGATDKRALLESVGRLFGGETRDVLHGELLALARGESRFEAETSIKTLDGRALDVVINVAFPEPGESLDSVLVSVSDITHRKQAENTLRRSETLFREMADTAPVMLWISDREAQCTFLSRSWYEFTGQTAEGALGSGWTEAIHPDDRESATASFLQAHERHDAFRLEYRLRHRCGAYRWVIDTGRPRFDDAGGFGGHIGALVDITERKEAETALRQEVDVRRTLAQIGASLAGELRSEKLVQAVTDASTRLTEAEFGAFFYNVTNGAEPSHSRYSLARTEAMDISKLPHAVATQGVGPAFHGDVIARLDDLVACSGSEPTSYFDSVLEPPLPVRSYLSVPVVGRGGTVLGGMVFGHRQAGVFTERHEILAAGVAAWAAIALDNARLYQDAEEANRLKDEFLATLSHELRTPLNAVLGWAHMLREGTLEPAMHQRALESLERNARAQAQLVEDLLDVSRIMAGKLLLRTDAVDLGFVITNAVDTVRAGVTAKRLHLQVQVPTDRRIVVTGDPDRLQQVVWNLVSNAIKFTPSGGRVDVELAQRDSKAEIVVRDTGQGIDTAFQPHLFQRFRQMDASKTGLHGGLGLGLSIVRHLTEAHGGTVAAESEGVGCGATFRVLLPLRSVEDVRVDGARVGPLPVDFALAGVRALVVDDEPDAREATQYVLETRGALVVSTGSAGEALHLLARDRFDVLIAGIGMPEQDGLALIRATRALPARSPNRDIPAIAMTAHTGIRERDEAFAAGFGSHLGKPVDPERLVAVVSTITARANPRR